ncbi:pyruvate formate lyase family protein [Escherichia coli]
MRKISRHNAEHKPQTFWQACQLFWYMNIILQYESNASSLSLGRFDQILAVLSGIFNPGRRSAFLKELLESLWVKCNDIVLLRSTSSARYFAGFPTGYTALLGGLTENGRSAVNASPMFLLCLDAYQSVQLPQPNLGVRTNALIDTPFLMKTADYLPAIGIRKSLTMKWWCQRSCNRGVSLEMRHYSVVGCVELSIPGRTYRSARRIAMFNLLKVMEICLHENEGNAALTYEGLPGSRSAPRSATTSP